MSSSDGDVTGSEDTAGHHDRRVVEIEAHVDRPFRERGLVAAHRAALRAVREHDPATHVVAVGEGRVRAIEPHRYGGGFRREVQWCGVRPRERPRHAAIVERRVQLRAAVVAQRRRVTFDRSVEEVDAPRAVAHVGQRVLPRPDHDRDVGIGAVDGAGVGARDRVLTALRCARRRARRGRARRWLGVAARRGGNDAERQTDRDPDHCLHHRRDTAHERPVPGFSAPTDSPG